MQDHTSITRFIETKWNLGAMTYRDANAADMTDYFDFRAAELPGRRRRSRAPVDPAPGLFGCGAAGQHPPLPPAGAIA